MSDVVHPVSHPDLQIHPSPGDAGTVGVGTLGSVEFQVVAPGGVPVEVSNVQVTNLTGEGFYNAGPTAFSLGPDEPDTTVLVEYLPSAAGDYLALLEITYNGRNSPAVTEVMGRAVVPRLLLYPPTLDFGTVAVGDMSRRALTVMNLSEYTVLLSDADIDASEFELAIPLPLEVAGRSRTQFDLHYAPIDTDPSQAVFTLWVLDAALSPVGLIGND